MITSAKLFPLILGVSIGILMALMVTQHGSIIIMQGPGKLESNTNNKQVFYDISTVLNKTVPSGPSLNEDWGKVSCNLVDLSQHAQNLYDYISAVTFNCQKKVMIGGKVSRYYFDGEKWGCLDGSFKFKFNNCTVLSFGISVDWTFDEEMANVYGCQVYAFDPTIGQEDHEHSKGVKFFNMGISDGPGTLGKGKLDSYSNILEKLNLTNTAIDYLKMDVEGAEFRFFKDVLTRTPNLLKNVKQIGMEIHLSGGVYASAWEYFQRLDCLGFKVMFINFNPVVGISITNGKRRTSLYEIVWAQDRSWA